MMEELDISNYSSKSNSNIDLNQIDLEKELVTINLDEDIIYEKKDIKTSVAKKEPTNNELFTSNQETFCNSIFKDFCLNFWENKMPQQLELIQFNLNNDSPITTPKEIIKLNETLNDFNFDYQTKRVLKVDDSVRRAMLDFESWNLDKTVSQDSYLNELAQNRNFTYLNKHRSNIITDKNRNDALNQTLGLFRSQQSLLTTSSLNSSDDLTLKKAISDLNKTERLSNISTVTGSFSSQSSVDNQIEPVYIPKP